MGLAERRLAEAIKNEQYPEFEKAIHTSAGYPIAMNMDWDSFTAFDEYPLKRLINYFEEIKTAIADICRDEMGKSALKEKLQTIQLKNSDNSDDVRMVLENNTFSLVVQFAGGTYSSYSGNDMIKYLEPLL